MSLTTDRNDPELGHGADTQPGPQNKKYLVLSDAELAKGFVRPVRHTYVHQYRADGQPIPYPMLKLDPAILGCGAATKMGTALAETYARDPKFYGATYCVGCQMHLPVSQFTWEDHEVVGS